MMREETRQLQQQGALRLGIRLSEEQLAKIAAYLRLLAEKGQGVNLTRITEEGEAAVRHFIDSWTCSPFIERGSLIDVGAGAGFPGLAIKIARPEIDVTLLEATAKKAAFLEQAVEMLALEGVRVLNIRAEEAGRGDRRESYDYATARAVGPLAVVAELCLPLLKVGGKLLAQRGEAGSREAVAAEPDIGRLGGRVEQARSVKDHTGADNYLLVIEKTRPTPEKYPRRNGVPQKRPLWK
jgi:16S rRNA (guanine527-N7)-methyltransferase